MYRGAGDGSAAMGSSFQRHYEIKTSKHPAPNRPQESLLEDQNNFEFSESSHFCGRHFLRAMVRTADNEAKLNAVGRNSGSFTSRHRRDSRGMRLDQRKDCHPSRNQFDKAYGKNQGYSHQNNGYVTILSNISLVDKKPISVGGRLGSYALAWNRFSKDPWVLSIVIWPSNRIFV